MFKKFLFLVLFVLLIGFNSSFSQTYKLTGVIKDLRTEKPLSFVTVKVIDTAYGTVADQNGEYIIKLQNGYYKAVFSYIGYFSDTASIYIEDKDFERNIFLRPTGFMTEEIEVFGEDPAYDIIRRAIKYKKLFKKELNEYNYDAYSKFVVRSNINPTSEKDTTTDKSKMNIFGILESETKGYFKKPDLEKQIIKSKKETANILKGFAIPMIVNFYDEEIDLNEAKIPGPLCDDAFDSYEYKLINITSIDSIKIYKINVINTSNLVPQFTGNIYIIDSIYALMKVSLKTNDVGLPRGVDNIDFIQKFTSYWDKNKKSFWMPTDIEIFADGSFLGLVKFKAEVFTIVSNYNLNVKAPLGTFDDIVIKILPDATKKDSAYWENNQLIKNTDEEKITFEKIAREEMRKSKTLSLGIASLQYGKNFSLSLLDAYSFNRVSGHQIGLNAAYNKDFGKYSAESFISYGFGDKKTKYDISAGFRLLNDKNLQIKARFFNNLNGIFVTERTGLRILDNNFYTLFYKKDKFNYYYGNGYSLSIRKSIIPQLRFGLIYSQEKQTSGYKNSDFSFLKKSQNYPDNPLVSEAFKRTIGFELRIDPNSFLGIDWGDGEISRFRTTALPRLIFRYDYSGKNLLSTFENRRYSFNFYGQNKFSSFINLEYRFGGVYINGAVPYQDLAYFQTHIQTEPENMAFIVMDYNEYLGDKVLYLNLENNFGRFLWEKVPYIKGFDLIGFFNAGKSDISGSNKSSLSQYPYETSITDGVYMEAGFAISRIMDIGRINFGWRLNKFKQGRNFFIVFSFGL
ncbi:MAG: DUF5686 family protein [Ignavibacteria bacterium]|jgi:hypothetical protein